MAWPPTTAPPENGFLSSNVAIGLTGGDRPRVGHRGPERRAAGVAGLPCAVAVSALRAADGSAGSSPGGAIGDLLRAEHRLLGQRDVVATFSSDTSSIQK